MSNSRNDTYYVVHEEKESAEKGVSTEDPLSTAQPKVSTDKPEDSTDKLDEGTDKLKVSTDKEEVSTDRLDEENKYPLKKEVLSKLLKLKLETEEDSTMDLELIRFIKKQIAELESEDF
ncbi:hypothetical protein Tco_0937869 [Tanacetum coccineum]|uniref:Uncharacterized protein n=1 Tax=Tanacetum coccineum TaxID=301880 RepID=A0ABQ5DMJ4_9ASTR